MGRTSCSQACLPKNAKGGETLTLHPGGSSICAKVSFGTVRCQRNSEFANSRMTFCRYVSPPPTTVWDAFSRMSGGSLDTFTLCTLVSHTAEALTLGRAGRPRGSDLPILLQELASSNRGYGSDQR